MRGDRTVILLAEDDPDDTILIERAFRGAGLGGALHVMTDGGQALAYLSGEGDYADRDRHPLPGLIILDLKLPRMSGHEIIAWIRARLHLQQVPVIVLSGSDQPADIRRAYELGANSYITKPHELEAWLEMAEAIKRFWLVWNEQAEASNG